MAINEALTNQIVEQQGVMGHLRQRSVALLIAGALSPIVAGALAPNVASGSPNSDTLSAPSAPPIMPSSPDVSLGKLIASEADSSAGSRDFSTVQAIVAAVSSKPKCEYYASGTVDLSDADNAILPLASEVISVYRHTKPSERRQVTTSEMYGASYQHVTEIDSYITARMANSHSIGTYILNADFKGRIIPKDMVAVQTEEYPKSLGPRAIQTIPGEGNYDFLLLKTTRNGDSNTLGLHWNMSLGYDAKQKSYTFMQSKIANGAEVTSSYSMTEPILKADTDQAIVMLDDSVKHRPIKQLRDLAKSQKLVRVCS